MERKFFVSPNGSDSATERSHFLTIQRAMLEVRKFNKDMHSDITVSISGKHHLTERLLFTADDSGFNGCSVIYKSTDGALISGGVIAKDWTVDDAEKGIWKACAHGIRVRQLYIDGVKGKNAVIDGINTWIRTETGYSVPAGSIDGWRNPSDMEMIYHSPVWEEGRIGVQEVNGDQIIMKQPGFRIGMTSQPQYNVPARICNAYEFIAEEGDWCVDTKADLLYYKAGDKDPNKSEIIICALEKLISVEGTFDAPVHDLVFDGLTFHYATWFRPNSDKAMVAIQANLSLVQDPENPGRFLTEKPRGVIDFESSYNIKLINNTFAKLGGAAVSFDIGCHDNMIVGNDFYDIANGAIQIGAMAAIDAHPNWDDMRRRVYNISVLNNYIHQIGQDYFGAVAVLTGHATAVEIAYNEICDLPYSAISVGWGWGGNDRDPADPTIDGKHHIHHNHIHKLMQKMIDGGGIYTLGSMPGTFVDHNVVHDQSHDYGCLYYDDGTRGVTMTNNVVYDTVRSVILKGANNVLKDNYYDIDRNNMFNLYDDTSVIKPNTLAKDGNFPLDILNGAGLQRQYLHLLPANRDADLAYDKKVRVFDSRIFRNSVMNEGKGANVVNKDYTQAADDLAAGSGLIVDLEREFSVSSIAVSSESEGGLYRLESSCDGINWEKIKDIKCTENSREITVLKNPAYMRDIRLTVLEGLLRVSEIEVYEGAAPKRDGGYLDFELYVDSVLDKKVATDEDCRAILKGIYRDGFKERYHGEVKFTASAPDIIAIDKEGFIKALKPGAAKITAEFGTRQLVLALESYIDVLQKVEVTVDKEFYHTGETGTITIKKAFLTSGKKADISKAGVSYRIGDERIAHVTGNQFKIDDIGNTLAVAAVTLNGVTVEDSTAVSVYPDGWEYARIGGDNMGSVYFNGSDWHITSNGENIFSAADDFTYLYRFIDMSDYPNGISIETCVDDIDNKVSFVTMCGLMFREGINRDSKNVNYRLQVQRYISEDKGRAWMAPLTYRLENFFNSEAIVTNALHLGTRIMLSYKDKTAYAHYWDADKNVWTQAGKVDIAFGARFAVGVAHCSGTIHKKSYADGHGLLIRQTDIELK